MLSDKKGQRIAADCSDYVVFDLETTGVSPKSDRVIEISAIKVRDGVCVDEYSELVNPECHIHEAASAVNGITDDMVAGAPTFDQVLPGFIDFIGDMVLIGHNIHGFDMKFLYRDCQVYFGKTLNNNYLDTLFMAKKCLPELAHHRMTDLAVHYGISTAGAHRALHDCRMTQAVYECMKKEDFRGKKGGKSTRTCTKCGKVMRLRNGRFGEFWGCSGYPACTYTENR